MYSRSQIISKLVYSIDQLSAQNLVGDILVTAKRSDQYDGEFPNKLNKLNACLKKLFSKGVSIVTRSDSGKLHAHIGVEMPGPVTNFDWVAFEQSERYYNLYKHFKDKDSLKFYNYYTKKYRNSLPTTWQVINSKLMSIGKKLGLGRIFLTPIRKNLTAYKWYLVSNVPYKREKRDKYIRFFFSWGMAVVDKCQILNKYTKAYRNKLKSFAEGLQLTSESYNMVLRDVLGNSWHYRVNELIKHIDSLDSLELIKYNELKSTVALHLLRSQ